MKTNSVAFYQKGGDVHLQAAGNNPATCVWMRTGAVNFHLCERDGDCANCPFDRGMRNFVACQNPAEGGGRSPGWPERMRAKYPGNRKPCVHFLNGSLESFTACRRNYDCDDCPIGLELEYRPMLRDLRLIQQKPLEERP